MKIFENLQPKHIWQYFEQILAVPRPSKKEEKIIAFLLDFAKTNNIEAQKDLAGNIVMRKKATKGYENRKTVILQSHIDMVCEKNEDVNFNFETDPIKAQIQNNWVTAKGTTLGADDGIGIAAQMAILTDNSLKHGAIECLFTVDEETGLSGAKAIREGFMTGKTLINLDSEDEGELFIGCAGGRDTVARLTYSLKKTPNSASFFSIKVSGLKGGHSGDDINKGLANAIKILNTIILEASKKFKLHLSVFEGGNLRNAIAREAQAIIAVKEEKTSELNDFITAYIQTIKKAYQNTEPTIQININQASKRELVLKSKSTKKLLNVLQACPHGVIAMSTKMNGMVETSTNLASVRFSQNNTIDIVTSQRSDSAHFLDEICTSVESVFNLAGAKVTHSDGYPGWTPNTDSQILKITVDAYKRLFETQPIVRSIHAGLECGLFLQKYPDLDMISFGPTIRQVHSPDEKLDINTVTKFWNLLVEVLENIPPK